MLGYFTPMLPVTAPLALLQFINAMKMQRRENMVIELGTLSTESSLHWSLILQVAWDVRPLYFTGVQQIYLPFIGDTRIQSDYKLVKMPLVLCVVTLCHLMYPRNQVFYPLSCAWATGLINGPILGGKGFDVTDQRSIGISQISRLEEFVISQSGAASPVRLVRFSPDHFYQEQ